MGDDGGRWHAVRCVFRIGWPRDGIGNTYEERITLWRARSHEEAIERAEAEARDYAAAITEQPYTYLSFAQSYELYDVPVDGAEVFSLMRDSPLDPMSYLDRFFESGSERQQPVDDATASLGDPQP